MNSLARWFSILALSLLPAGAALAQDEVSHTALKGPLHLLQGKGGNVMASIGQDGILLIDSDYTALAPGHERALGKLDESGRSPRFLLNTHWHLDHTGGNAYWRERGAVILAHDNVVQRMSTRQEIKAFKRVMEPSPPEALPVVTYGDSMALHFNGDDIEIHHFPASHTDGDSVVFFAAENVVHTGDIYFKDRFPFVNIDAGGNVFGCADSVKRILQRIDDDTLVVPGHGALANKADLQRYHDMLVATGNTVKYALERGQSLEAIVAAGLGERWQSWGKSSINEAAWISFIAASL
jgi:glyoxylase-like metal-dependent hydrolase (beta-lactamase superfamily II)